MAFRKLDASVLGRLMYRAGWRFYLLLGILFLALYFLVPRFIPLLAETEFQTFDLAVQAGHRLGLYERQEEDQRVVVVDIDEASLDALSDNHGRWPWPRSVFAEFLEHLSLADPLVVGIDILFTDPDINDRSGDEYLGEVLDYLDNIYLSAVRLPPENDGLSEFTADLLPTVSGLSGDPSEKVAVLLPMFPAALEHRRFAFTNKSLKNSTDGIVRYYPVAFDIYGARVPSLAAQLAVHAGAELPASNDILVNFLSAEANVDKVSFVDAFHGLRNSDPDMMRLFRGRAIIVGTSAPGISAVSYTPISDAMPSLHIVGAATENLINDTWYREFSHYFGLAVFVALALMVLAIFAFDIARKTIDAGFAVVDFMPVVLAAVLVVVFGAFVDVTFAAIWGLAFYGTARLFHAIYNKQLRGGELLVGYKGLQQIAIISGSFRFEDEEAFGEHGKQLEKGIDSISRRIAVSEEVFNDQVPLLAKSGRWGTVFYAVIEPDRFDELYEDLRAYLESRSEAMEFEYSIRTYPVVENSWSNVIPILNRESPLLIKEIQEDAS